MTEETGWPPAEPAETQAEVQPVPEVGADPQDVAEQAADAEPAEDHVPPPFVPSEGVAPWLRDVVLEFHRRLRAAGW